MVDYNIAIPQQQLFQAPDMMQNFMRMQQMDQLGATARLRNAQAEQLRGAQQQTAAEREQMVALDREVSERLQRTPSPTQLADEFMREGKPAAAAKVVGYGQTLNTGRDSELKTIGDTLRGYTYHGSRIQTPEEAYDYGVALAKDPTLGPYLAKFGPKTPEQAGEKARADFMRNPDLYRKQNSEFSADKLFDAIKPADVDLPGGGKGYKDPNRPGVIKPYGVEEFNAPQPDAGGGRVDTYPVSPTRVAGFNAGAGRTGGAPIVQDQGQGVRVAMGGPAPGAPVNAMAPAQPSSPYGAAPVANAMAPQQPGIVGMDVLAQRAKEKEMADSLLKVGQETLARERATATVKGETETKTRQETAGRVLQVLNDPVIDELIAKSTSGSIQRNVAEKIGAFGASTSGMENIGRLNTIQESLLFRLANGKLGGGFTDKDTDTIRGMLGRIADPDTPANVRAKTLQDVRAMMQSVATGESMTIAPAAGGKSRRAAAQPAAAVTAQGTEGAKRISSKTEYDALPAGSVYIDPNGAQRTKR
jgi:hypothetical protein